jgi:hypothetical protein
MQSIHYDTKPNFSEDNETTTKNETIAKPVDYYGITNEYQKIIIQKTLETSEIMSKYLSITNPLGKMTLIFILLNPIQTWNLLKNNYPIIYSSGIFIKRSLFALINRKPQPIKKTFEICYFVDNSINHIYIAFDWYLKSNSKFKKSENHTVVILTKPIEASNVDKNYKVLKTVPEKKETEFTYENCTFSYAKSSYEDVIYAQGGEIKKKNYKLLIWSFDCTPTIFDNLSTHVINLYAKSKIDDIWVQKIYNHQNGTWKDTNMGINKRTMSSVFMKNDQNLQILESLNYFVEREEWHLQRGISYKRVYFCYGPPGTGKSSFIKAMSNEFQKHIHNINLSTIKDDNEFSNLMSRIVFKDTILLIEDIDVQSTIVHKKSNDIKPQNTEINHTENAVVQMLSILNDAKLLKNNNNNENKTSENEDNKSKLTLSALLNFLDGVATNHGMIVVITTNHPEKLDEALVRDGRIDEKIFFDYCDHEMIFKMFNNFYEGSGERIPTLNEIKSKIKLNEYNIAPCNVENSMKRNYNNPELALNDIINLVKNKFEEYNM